jgi:hypothetical protein
MLPRRVQGATRTRRGTLRSSRRGADEGRLIGRERWGPYPPALPATLKNTHYTQNDNASLPDTGPLLILADSRVTVFLRFLRASFLRTGPIDRVPASSPSYGIFRARTFYERGTAPQSKGGVQREIREQNADESQQDSGGQTATYQVKVPQRIDPHS